VDYGQAWVVLGVSGFRKPTGARLLAPGRGAARRRRAAGPCSKMMARMARRAAWAARRPATRPCADPWPAGRRPGLPARYRSQAV